MKKPPAILPSGVPKPKRKKKLNSAYLKVRRKKLGMTIEAAAEITKCSIWHWVNVENGKRGASPTFLKRMAATLQCDVEDMFDTTEKAVKLYLDLRLQDAIQSAVDPDRPLLFEKLNNTDFLNIAKNMGYVRDRADLSWEERLRLQGKDPESLMLLIVQFLGEKRQELAEVGATQVALPLPDEDDDDEDDDDT